MVRPSIVLNQASWEDQHHGPQSYYNKLWAKLSVGLRAQAARRAARLQATDIEANVRKERGSTVEYTDVQSDQAAIRLIADYLEEIATRYPEQEAEQLKKSVWFAIGYLQG